MFTPHSYLLIFFSSYLPIFFVSCLGGLLGKGQLDYFPGFDGAVYRQAYLM